MNQSRMPIKYKNDKFEKSKSVSALSKLDGLKDRKRRNLNDISSFTGNTGNSGNKSSLINLNLNDNYHDISKSYSKSYVGNVSKKSVN